MSPRRLSSVLQSMAGIKRLVDFFFFFLEGGGGTKDDWLHRPMNILLFFSVHTKTLQKFDSGLQTNITERPDWYRKSRACRNKLVQRVFVRGRGWTWFFAVGYVKLTGNSPLGHYNSDELHVTDHRSPVFFIFVRRVSSTGGLTQRKKIRNNIYLFVVLSNHYCQ